MVHPLTHKAIAAYVLNTGLDKVPENPTFNEKQTEKLEILETAVDQCASDAFVELSKNHSMTIQVNKYPFFN